MITVNPTSANYYGVKLNVFMRCPLGNPNFHTNINLDIFRMGNPPFTATDYAFYYGTEWSRDTPRLSQGMKKIGDAFVSNTGTARDKEFHILASDKCAFNQRKSIVWTTHNPGFGVSGSQGWGTGLSWQLALGTYSDANYQQFGAGCVLDGTYLTGRISSTRPDVIIPAALAR